MTEKEIEQIEKLSKRIILSSPTPILFAYIYLLLNGQIDSWYKSMFLKIFSISAILIFIFLLSLPLFIKFLKKNYQK